MQTDDGAVAPGPWRPVLAPARVPGPVTVVVVLERPVTDDDLDAAAAVGVDAVTTGDAPFAADPTVLRVSVPVAPATLGTTCAALHRGVRVVVCDAAALDDCAGTVRTVRTYEALLEAAVDVPERSDGTGAP